MIIKNIYSQWVGNWRPGRSSSLDVDIHSSKLSDDLKFFLRVARGWDIDFKDALNWMNSEPYRDRFTLAQTMIAQASEILARVENLLGSKLQGELWCVPSLEWFDGFARYDVGGHKIFFGVDHPDATEGYLQAILAHELSHVYRDYQPNVWPKLSQPIGLVSRDEYTESMDWDEHLVSEGLATLFSQLIFPEVPKHLHHYYSESEMDWCHEHRTRIHEAIDRCLKTDRDVWSFYGENRAGDGSPSRTHYFWAAEKIQTWLKTEYPKRAYSDTLVEALGWNASSFKCFHLY